MCQTVQSFWQCRSRQRSLLRPEARLIDESDAPLAMYLLHRRTVIALRRARLHHHGVPDPPRMRNLPRYTLPPSLVHMYDMQAFLTPFLGDNAPTRRKTGKLGLLALNPPAAVSTSDRLAVQPAYAPDGTGRPAVGTGFSRWRFDGTDPGLRNSLKTCRCSPRLRGAGHYGVEYI